MLALLSQWQMMMPMGNLEKISFIGLLLLALLLAGFLVYYHKELMKPASVSINLFDPNRPVRQAQGRVAQIRIIMKEDNWQQLKANVRAKQYFRADFWFDSQLVKNVAIRPKGMSSLMSAASGTDRLPLKVDFNFFNAAQTFQGIKKLALNNGFSDPTFIRETISYELFEQMGLPTPRRAFADVWVNDIFRTPVKDPAEIGYLMLLIAMSIGAATHTYLIAIILFIIVFLSLSIQWLIRNRFSFRSQTNLMISVEKTAFQKIEPKLTQFLKTRLNNLTLKTTSILDDRVSIHYQHKRMSASDKVQFIAELNKLAEPGGIEFFAG
jgi:hypothetical protein